MTLISGEMSLLNKAMIQKLQVNKHFLVLLLILLAIPLTVFVALRQQNISQKAAEKEVQTVAKGEETEIEKAIKEGRGKKYKGYIVEFTSDPVTKQLQKTGRSIKSANTVLQLNQELQNEHNTAKQNILKLLGEKSIAEARESTADTIAILQEYTTVFNGIALDITDTQAQKIKTESPYVKSIEPNYQVKTTLSESVPLIHANEVWQLQDASQNNITGQGIKIGIMDTGVDYTHPDLGGCFGNNCKVTGGYDFVNKDADPKDDNGHGTHVAATAAGNGVLKGVAPDAKIVVYKVLDYDGYGFGSNILAGIERSMDPNQDGNLTDHLDVINLSLGGGGTPDGSLARAIDNAALAGVVAAISAGNSGPTDTTIGAPGVARGAITVGAVDKSKKIAQFSSIGPVPQLLGSNYELLKPNVVAPGVSICAALSNQHDVRFDNRACLDATHMSISGTSMAAPHVAGAAALLKQAHPDWTPENIKSALMTTADDAGYNPLTQGSGMINVLSAIQATSLITPASLSFGLVDKSQEQWQSTKTILVKNVSQRQQTYTFSTKTSIPGVQIIIADTLFSLSAGQQKETQVTLQVNHTNLAEGTYFNEIIINEETHTYRVPLFFFKKQIEIYAKPNPSRGKLPIIEVKTPYVSLLNAPQLFKQSPVSSQSSIPLIQKSDLFTGPILTTWQNQQIVTLEEEGIYNLTASSAEMPQYTTTLQVPTDKTSPTFLLTPIIENQRLRIDAKPSELLATEYGGDLIDAKTDALFPTAYAEKNNVYAVFVDYIYVRMYFTKSNDYDQTWTTPKILYENVNAPRLIPPVAITKFQGKLFLAYSFDNTINVITSNDDGNTWSNPVIIDTTGDVMYGYQRSILLGSNKNGVHIFYQTTDAVARDTKVYLKYRTSPDGVNWSNPSTIYSTDRKTGGINWPDGASAHIDDENLTVTYNIRHTSGSSPDTSIYFATSTDGTNWNTQEIIRENKLFTYPSLAQDQKNNILIVWRVSSAAPWRIDGAKSTDGGTTWSIKRNITNATDEESDMAPAIRYADNKLTLLAVRNGVNFVKTSSDFGETWSNTVLLYNTSLVISDGAIATSGNITHLFWSAGFLPPARLVYTNDIELSATVTGNNTEKFLSLTKSSDSYQGETTLETPGIYSINLIGKDIAGNIGTKSASIDSQPSPTPTPEPVCNVCTADFNRDGGVDIVDFSKFLKCFDKEAVGNCATVNTNNNNIIDIEDFSCMQNYFGKQCQQ